MSSIENHDRREFIKKGISMGLAAGGTLLFGHPGDGFAGDTKTGLPDLVEVSNAAPNVLFNKGIELMGGMNRFVQKGQTVVVKPNMVAPMPPEFGATTNPLLVKTVVEHCYNAGASKVYVFDNVGALYAEMADQCYKKTGIADAAASVRATIAPANDEKYYQNIKIPGATVLKTAAVHELILESDVFINIPIVKNHNFAGATMAMKNLMGVVWDRIVWHTTDLDRSIAEFCLFKTPDLNVVDAWRVMKRFGPHGRSPEDLDIPKTLYLSTDIVAADAAAVRILGRTWKDIDHIRLGHELGVGTAQIDRLKVKRHVIS